MKKSGADTWKITSVGPVNQGLSLICISILNKEKLFDTLYKHLQCSLKRLILSFSSLKSQCGFLLHLEYSPKSKQNDRYHLDLALGHL